MSNFLRTPRIMHSLPYTLYAILIIVLLFKNKRHPELCNDLLSHGRWTSHDTDYGLKREWHTYSSLIQRYEASSLHDCLNNRYLHFSGDSIVRQTFWAVAEKINSDRATSQRQMGKKHEDTEFVSDGLVLAYYWDPFLDRNLTSVFGEGHPGDAGTLLSTGLWQARHSGRRTKEAITAALADASNVSTKRKQAMSPSSSCYLNDCSPAIMIPPPHLNFGLLSPERAATLTEPSLRAVSNTIRAITEHNALEIAWATQLMTRNNPLTLDETGLHVTNETASLQANILLNRLCNDKVLHGKKASAYACMTTSGDHSRNWLAGICLSFAACMTFLPLVSHSQPSRLSSLQSVATLIATACYCRLADRTVLFSKSDKVVSVLLFVVLSCFLLVATVYFTRPSSKKSHQELPDHVVKADLEALHEQFLSRSQTEEWKGWMQIVILLYHYFGMSRVLWVYQFIRVLVASYLFLTGYGHATYFQQSQNFSAHRLVAVLMRLNTLPVILAYLMDNTYDFYYFPCLASFWVLITYITFWKHAEHESTVCRLIRILLSSLLLMLILSGEYATSALLQIIRLAHGPQINSKELLFRIKLDLCAPYFGMVTSVLVHRSGTFPGHLIPFKWSYWKGLKQVVLVNFALILLISYYIAARSFANKFSYNRWHTILSILPITAYVILRNINESLRGLEVPILRWIGTISLELFVLQYHIWLAADTKGILRLGLIDIPALTEGKTVVGSWTFWVETVLISIMFVWLSDHCARATNAFAKLFVNVNEGFNKGAQKQVILTRVALLLTTLWLLNLALQTGRS